MTCSTAKPTKTLLVHKTYLIVAATWTLLITYLSLSDVGGLGSFIAIPHKDKMAHFVFYFLFYILWLSYLRLAQLGFKVEVKLLFFAIGYGVLMEVLQAVMGNHRSSDVFDVVANSVGAFAGFYYYRRFLLNKNR